MRKIALFVLALLLPVSALAHVSVKPSEVGVGAYQTFMVSVPTEKDMPTTNVRLVIPAGLESVRPNVKPGWEIQIVKEGTGEGAVVKEIIWSSGSIPADQRDEFVFSAKTPAQPMELRWNAYQTYSDSSVVAWDASATEQPKDASGEDDFSVRGPYSTTEVINDLVEEPTPSAVPVSAPAPTYIVKENNSDMDAWVMIALLMSSVSLALCIQSSIKRRQDDVV